MQIGRANTGADRSIRTYQNTRPQLGVALVARSVQCALSCFRRAKTARTSRARRVDGHDV